MSDFLLTIGIPTYNGSKTIADALDSFVSQIDGDLLNKIELVVSNNASTDNTVEIVSEYIKQYPDNIRLIENSDTHLELDGNLINLFNNAAGKYVWIMSDDDAFENDSFNKVINVINDNADLAVIFTNYLECDKVLKPLSKRLRDDISLDSICLNGDDFFLKSKVLFGLLSSLIFRVRDWKSANLDNYIGLNSLHVGALIEILRSGKSYIVSEKLVKLRTGNTSWGKKGTFIFPILNIVRMFKGMEGIGYSKYTENYLVDHFFNNNLKSLIIANSQGLKDKRSAFSGMRFCYSNKIFFWIIHIPVLYMPNILFYYLSKIVKIILKR